MGREARGKLAETTAPAAAQPLDDATVARIHGETKRMGVSERIAYWDKRQAAMVVVDAAGRQLTEADREFRVVERNGLETTGFGWPEGARLVPDPQRILCPNDAKHGALTMTASGALLICGERKQGAVCTGSVPVSL